MINELPKDNPYRKLLLDLINVLGEQLKMTEENQVLMLHRMNSEEKIIKLITWIKTVIDGDELRTTEIEVMHVVTLISRKRCYAKSKITEDYDFYKKIETDPLGKSLRNQFPNNTLSESDEKSRKSVNP